MKKNNRGMVSIALLIFGAAVLTAGTVGIAVVNSDAKKEAQWKKGALSRLEAKESALVERFGTQRIGDRVERVLMEADVKDYIEAKQRFTNIEPGGFGSERDHSLELKTANMYLSLVEERLKKSARESFSGSAGKACSAVLNF